jgi:hypothetical protein
MMRWLFEYSQENFRRQQHLNQILFACIEELALENARLRRDFGQSREHHANPEDSPNPSNRSNLSNP